MPQCYKCFLIINTFDQLFLHIKVYHPHDTTPFECLEKNCYRVYDSLKSFKKHTRVHSNSPINTHYVSTSSPNQPTNFILFSLMTQNQIFFQLLKFQLKTIKLKILNCVYIKKLCVYYPSSMVNLEYLEIKFN